MTGPLGRALRAAAALRDVAPAPHDPPQIPGALIASALNHLKAPSPAIQALADKETEK